MKQNITLTKRRLFMKTEIEKKLYDTLINMKMRCYNPTSKDYKNYGNRGITICDEWLDKKKGFINFRDWAMTNGYDKNLSIDRIDNDKGYSPDNCRWATRKEQANNRRQNRIGRRKGKKIEIDGKFYTAVEIATMAQVSENAIRRRYRAGVRGKNLLFSAHKGKYHESQGILLF